ncbi:hypothetical protein KR044_002821 [Drosophila immigrans]|nr:hypothetical protein KR044_002821 [Drosophila immigrans]
MRLCFASLGWILLMCSQSAAYKIPNVDLVMLSDRGFEVSIPDEPGLQRVFYLLQVDDICPALMDYITEATNGSSWVSRQKTVLQNNDKLQITVLVQYNGVIYERSETRVLLNERLLSTRHSNSRNIDQLIGQEQCAAIVAADQSSCKPAQSIVGSSSGQSICQGELLFEDNFDAAQLNRSVWTHDVRQRLYHDDEELVAFDNGTRNSYVKEGRLYIVPIVASEVTTGAFRLGDRCTAVDRPDVECTIAQGSFYKIKPPVYSAQLHTRNSFSFKYGKIVVRAKLPKGDWLFPIMLQPVSTHAETHYAKQMRIAYARGNAHLRSNKQEDISGNRLYGGMIVWQHGAAVQFLSSHLSKTHYGDEFHNYTMIWQQDKLTLMVDDDIYGELYDGLPFFNERCFIIFGVTVGGFLNFDDSILTKDVKPYKNREPRAALSFWQRRDAWASTWGKHSAMIIDYVRVYAE